MKGVFTEVTLNEVDFREWDDNDGKHVKMYSAMLFFPRDKENQYSKSESIKAIIEDSPEGNALFKHLLDKEGQKITFLGDLQIKKQGKSMTIDCLIDEKSLKPLDLKLKAA